MRTARDRELFLATFAILALELTIIRWMSQQVRLFAYLNNVLLISAFLGMGLGVALGARHASLYRWTLPALALLSLVLAFPERLGIVHLSMPDDAIQMWGLIRAPNVIRSFTIVATLFAAVTAVFVLAGTKVGEIFAERESLAAYSVDLAGSIAGIVAMTAASFLGAPPPVWFAVACIPIAWIVRDALAWISLAAILLLSFLSIGGARFSPYYRIDLDRATEISGAPIRLSVNRDFHQYMHDLSFRHLLDPSVPIETRRRLVLAEEMYRLPFFLSPVRGSAVVVGAGTGNDVAAALRQKFASVTAVEIDPTIAQIGRAMHPERPYSDPRVKLVVNDARAYFEREPHPMHDVVAYGLLDSHAMFSAMSSLRLDNYVYTEDGLRRAWTFVKSPGILCISFSASNVWLSDRLYATLRKATGVEPLIVPHGLQNGRFYIVAKGINVPAILNRYHIRSVPPGEQSDTIRIPTDDWPFLYLKPNAVPYSYMAVLALILITAVVAVRLVFRSTEGPAEFDPALFFMGAAFLLIETRGVTTLSLLFGSTWIVNAAVFIGILILAFVANTIVRRGARVNVTAVFLALFASLALNYFAGPGVLLDYPLAVRFLFGGLINALPVGLAGLAFSTLLRDASHADTALGSNLLGAVVGGCVEYLSIAIGLSALVLLAATFYLCALLALRRRMSSQLPVPSS